MVTDSILSAIIFKWAVINDVRVSRVLRVPGWMTSWLQPCCPALQTSSLFFKHRRTATGVHRACRDGRVWIAHFSLSFSLSHTHTHSGMGAGQQVPRCKALYWPYNPSLLILPSTCSPNTCIRSLLPVSKYETRVSEVTFTAAGQGLSHMLK